MSSDKYTVQMDEFARGVLQAQIKRFDDVLADPECEWDAMVDAALEVHEKLRDLVTLTAADLLIELIGEKEAAGFLGNLRQRVGPVDEVAGFKAATDEVLEEMILKPVRVYIACTRCLYEDGTYIGIWHPAQDAQQVTPAMVHDDPEEHPDAELQAFSIEGHSFDTPLTLVEAAAYGRPISWNEVSVLPHIDPKIWIACLECYEDGTWVGDKYRASNAEEVTPEMIHLWPTEHTELRVFSIDGRMLAEPITLAEAANPTQP